MLLIRNEIELSIHNHKARSVLGADSEACRAVVATNRERLAWWRGRPKDERIAVNAFLGPPPVQLPNHMMAAQVPVAPLDWLKRRDSWDRDFAPLTREALQVLHSSVLDTMVDTGERRTRFRLAELASAVSRRLGGTGA